jgi:hypothetical protein
MPPHDAVPPNAGHVVAGAAWKWDGKRVAVTLRNGSIAGESPVPSGSPAGWAADGNGACRWTLTGHRFDIIRYRIL